MSTLILVFVKGDVFLSTMANHHFFTTIWESIFKVHFFPSIKQSQI